MSRRLLGGALLAAALAGCETMTELKVPQAAPPPPRPKDIPAIRSTFVHELVTRRQVDGLKIRIYSTGELGVQGSSISSIKSPRAKVRLEVPAFVIRHPTQGLLLFDTGLSPRAESRARFGAFPEPLAQEPGRDLVSQLRADGVEPEEIKWVVLSDLHFDHAGMAEAFPEAELIVDSRELVYASTAAAAPKVFGYEAGVADAAARGRLRALDLSNAAPYASFDRAQDLFGDGTIFLIDLSGHAPGGLGLWANLDEGPVLLAGDAVWVLDNYQDMAPPAPALIYDAELYWRRVYQLRDAEAALPRLLIFPGHELIALRLKPRGDVTLAPFNREAVPARRPRR